MIVCLCRGISEAAVRGIMDSGAATVEEVGLACGAGGDCRACCPMLEEMLAEVGVLATAGRAS